MIQATLLLSLKDLDIHTRANSYFLAGTEEESSVKKLTVFIVDASEVKDYSFIANIPDDKKIFINVTTSEGIKTIFVGANMTTEQIDAVKNAPDKNPEQSLNEISKIATNNNFLMTGQAVSNDGSKEIQIVADETIPINVSLNRVVSKVLLTCSTDNVDGV
ncbi:MAG: fimbrial protein, partial [Bacteroides sp.]